MTAAGARALRWAAAGIAALVALNLVAAARDAATGRARGPASSSYATQPDGAAAYAELLAGLGHTIDRLRAPLSEAELDPRDTIVLLEPGTISSGAARRLQAFLVAGGRLVAADRAPQWLAQVLEHPPEWSPLPATPAGPLAPLPEVAGVATVSAAAGSWTDPGGGIPALGAPGRALLVAAAVGRGRALLLADPSVVHNARLDRAANAALGAALAGTRERPVVFVESVHGYGDATGLAALPLRWRWALGGLVLAALAWLAAHARRLGPPEPAARPLPPPRRDYVASLAAVLARTKGATEALEPVRAEARARVLRRTGLPRSATAATVVAAARRLGLDEREARAVVDAPTSDDDALVAGTALAKLGGRGGRG